MELDVDAARAAVQTIADAMGLAVCRGGGRGDPRDRQREHGRARCGSSRCSAATTRATSRSSPYGGAGPAARERRRQAHGLLPGDRPAGAGPALRDRRPRRRLPRRVRADRASASLDDGRPETRSRASSTSSAGARTTWLEREGIAADTPGRSATTADMRYHGQGYEIPVAIDPARSAGDGARDLEERFNQLHEQLYGFRMHGTSAEIVNLRAVGFGAVPKPRAAGGERAAGSSDASGAVVDEHRGRVRGRAARRRRSTTGRSCSPGHVVRGPGDRHRVRLDDRRPRPATSPRSTRTSTS